MQEGSVIIGRLVQADGAAKNRPAIVLREMPPFADLLVCGVSMQLHQEVVGFDERISPGDSDFSTCGLKAESLIRLGFLAVLPPISVLGTIGNISAERHHRLLQSLSTYLVK